MDTCPSSCAVASCTGTAGQRLKLVTARATVQLQTHVAAAMSQTRTVASQELLSRVKGHRSGAPNCRAVITWLWPSRTNFGVLSSPPPAAFRLAPAPWLSPGSTKTSLPAFQPRMVLSQPPEAIRVPSSWMATASRDFAAGEPRSDVTGPADALPAPMRRLQHFAEPSFAEARRRAPRPPSTGKATTPVSGPSESFTVSRACVPSYTRATPS
mmetsp:Transcript_63597/g.186607  ORF Transcript_63597/g.186607 Transcript_63597/m.186607 type:complete len:212 (+) Transcript_63597:325-960(+)